MNELRVFLHGNTDVVDSREVANLIHRPHNDLMKTIRTYCEYLGQGDFSQSDFFIPSTYTNTQNKEQPCYLLTKKGCDMVANKMTGEKGVLFTAAYVTAFEAMREHIMGEQNFSQLSHETEQAKISFQRAELLNQIALGYDGTYRQILQAYATKELVGEFALPLPKVERHTYTAGEIGKKLGISANKVGQLANKHHLKTSEYGAWFVDKSPYSSKEVETFRYFEDVVPVLRELL